MMREAGCVRGNRDGGRQAVRDMYRHIDIEREIGRQIERDRYEGAGR